MNALANSQFGELEKFLQLGYPDGKGPVTFARYTGQERDEERNAIVAKPPDILLTNYVMLELAAVTLFLSCAFMWPIISSALLKGPKVRPALMSARPSASRASMLRRCSGVYSSSAVGSLGRMVITPPDTLNSRFSPFRWPAFRRTDAGTTSGVLVLFLTVTVMIGNTIETLISISV